MTTTLTKPRVLLRFGVTPAQVESLEQAVASMAAAPVTAAGEDGTAGLEREWHAVLVAEGVRTTDHRAIAPGALIWRPLPIPIEWQEKTSWGHDGSVMVGAIETIERDGMFIRATGWWDLAGEDGAEAARLCQAGLLRWVSVDLEVLASQLVEIGAPPMMDDWWDWSIAAAGSGELEYDWYEEFTEARIMGATLVPFPAFPQAVIGPASVALPDVPFMGEANQVTTGLMASLSVPAEPPDAWFTDPGLTAPTPLVIEDSGRVYGHIAEWDTPHTGFPNQWIVAPKSPSSYAYATTGGVVRTAEGTEVRVGHLTMATGHADINLDYHAAASHYDNTGTNAVNWVYGEDDHGIWVAGCLAEGMTEERVRALRASAPSGDWRHVGGALDLLACLAVNVPGFPVLPALAASGMVGPAPDRRVGFLASGEVGALVAAGRVVRDPLRPVRDAMAALEARLRHVEVATAPLMGLAVEQIKERVGAAR